MPIVFKHRLQVRSLCLTILLQLDFVLLEVSLLIVDGDIVPISLMRRGTLADLGVAPNTDSIVSSRALTPQSRKLCARTPRCTGVIFLGLMTSMDVLADLPPGVRASA